MSPTLEVQQKPNVTVSPTVGIQLQPGAFGKEGRAIQQFGRSLQDVGSEVSSIGEKIKLAEEQDQYDQGTLDYMKFRDEQNSLMLKDRSYSRERFDQAHDESVGHMLENVSNREAKERLTNYYARQRSVQGMTMETSVHRRLVADARARYPNMMQNSVRNYFADSSPEGRAALLKNDKKKIANDVASGVITQADADNIMRSRTMMIAMEQNEINPEQGLEAVKDRTSLKRVLGLTDEEVNMLTAADMDVLQKDALAELDYAQDELEASKLEAINEVNQKVIAAASSGDFSGAQRILNANLPLLGFKEHGTRSDQLKKTSEFFGQTGKNWFKETHSWDLYYKHKALIAAGKLTNPALIWQSTGINGYSEQEAARLAKMISKGATAKDFRDSEAGKTYRRIVEQSDVILSGGLEAELALETGFRWLDDWRKNNDDATDRQAYEEAVRIANRVQITADAGELATRPEDLPGATLPPIETHPPSQRVKDEDIDSEFTPVGTPRNIRGGIQTVTTQKEYDALPKGTRYQDSNGNIGTKR